MRNIILIRYSEIHLKGGNRGFFEKALLKNLRNAVKEFGAKVNKTGSRYVVSEYKPENEEQLCTNIKRVFGVHSYSRAVEFNNNLNDIEEYFKDYKIYTKSFRVTTKRADKSFPLNSQELAIKIGGMIFKNNTAEVNLHNPETEIIIDIRENGKTYISDNKTKAYGGMPVGVSGKGMLMLSGGIDSPVAGFKMASRGMKIDAVHFHSFPYTSEKAKNKVLDLARLMSEYTGRMNVYVVPFTKIQEHIHKYCRPEFMVTIMRRFMMRITEKLALENGGQAIITGESLAQVASQTIEGITSTNSSISTVPVLRPLIASNKEEIMDIARDINTYNTSILPYEDCCTVFLPKNPIIRPKLDKVKAEEAKLNIEELIENAINGVELVKIG